MWNGDDISLRRGFAFLREYNRQYRPKEWLFEGVDGGKNSVTSLRKIFQRALAASGVKKDVKLFTLQHSFATPLLERGTDLRYIQARSGHRNFCTIETYTNVTRKGFENLKSPRDDMYI